MVKGQGHIVGPVSDLFATFSFHINRTNTPGDATVSKFELEKFTVKYMLKSKDKVT